jgi:hypothetical protein
MPTFDIVHDGDTGWMPILFRQDAPKISTSVRIEVTTCVIRDQRYTGAAYLFGFPTRLSIAASPISLYIIDFPPACDGIEYCEVEVLTGERARMVITTAGTI